MLSRVVLASSFACALVPAAAAAPGPRREGFTATFAGMGGVFNYASGCAGCNIGPSAGLELRVGWMFGSEARVAATVELAGLESWHEGGGRVHGVLVGALSLWIDRVSLSIGVGAATTDTATVPGQSNETVVNGGVAVVASVGLDVVRWQKTALVVRALVMTGDYLEGTGVNVALAIGVDGFGIGGGSP
jgi:hypothetical protein